MIASNVKVTAVRDRLCDGFTTVYLRKTKKLKKYQLLLVYAYCAYCETPFINVFILITLCHDWNILGRKVVGHQKLNHFIEKLLNYLSITGYFDSYAYWLKAS